MGKPDGKMVLFTGADDDEIAAAATNQRQPQTPETVTVSGAAGGGADSAFEQAEPVSHTRAMRSRSIGGTPLNRSAGLPWADGRQPFHATF